MPTIGETIKFKAGLYEDYAALPSSDIDVNTIYFCTDTQQLFVGDSEYTRKIQTGQGVPTEQSASDMPVGTLYYDSTNQVLYSNLSNSWMAVANNISVPVMTGAMSFRNGKAGLVPAPTTRDYEYFLRGDGTWVDPDDQYNLSQRSSIDFDSLEMTNRKTGYWFCHRTSNITFSNAPPNIQSSGTFVVRMQFFDGTDQRIQTCYYVSSGQMYQRTWVYNGSETTWNPWKKIAMFATSSYTIDSVPRFNVTGDLVSSGYSLGTSVPSDAVFTDTTYEPATQSADGLMSSADKTKLDSIVIPSGSYYGTCASTEKANQVKNIVISSDQHFVLATGCIIGIKFAASNTYSSTAAAPVKFTFNSDTTQYPIYYKNAVSPTGTATAVYGLANYITYYMFDGTNLVWVGQDVDNNTDTKVTQSATPATGTFDLLMAKTAGSHTAETNTAYKSGANLNYDVANSKLKVGGQNVLTAADIVVCTQAEYDAMSTRTGLLYFIKEAAT